MEADRGRCSRESITQPMCASCGGLELWRVFFFLGICKMGKIIIRTAAGRTNSMQSINAKPTFAKISQ